MARMTQETAKRPSSSSLLGLVAHIFAGDVRQVTLSILMLVAVGASALIALSFGHIIKRLVDSGFDSGNAAMLDRTLLVMLALIGGMGAASFLRLSVSGLLSERVVGDLRRRIFARLLTLDPGFYLKNHSGELTSRITADTSVIQTVIATSLPLLARNVLITTGGFLMLVMTSPSLTLLVGLALPFVIVPVILFGRIVRRRSREAQDSVGLLGIQSSEALQAIETVQSYGAEKLIEDRFSGATQEAAATATRQTFSRAALGSSIILVLFSAICFVLWKGSHDVLAGKMSGGELSSFVFYAVLVATGFGVLGEVGAAAFRAAGALDRLDVILQSHPDVVNGDIVPDAPARGGIVFSNVGFTYPNAQGGALGDYSLTIPAGQTIAIVGPSGAGKTTLFSLVLRFFETQRGTITLDGQDIRRLDLGYLRAQIGYVPQQPFIFSGTVRENILIARPGATEGEMLAAATAAIAHDFIAALPDGYDTRLGDRGARLSGGQKQRIALARAFLKDAPVLLLDEATSALDGITERAVQEALARFHGHKTVLVIAHRLTTIQNADRIVVMDKGQIVEQGGHADLLRLDGLYARMAGLQMSEEERKALRLLPDLPKSLH